ncbi:MAG: hypothetical protein ABSG15_05900 [FCB group bacterium]|jgi:gas vesicle protein
MRNYKLVRSILLFILFLFISNPFIIYSQQQKSKEKIYLENIGVMASSNIYLNYITISFIKDNLVNKSKTINYDNYNKISKTVNRILGQLQNKVSELQSQIKLSSEDAKLLSYIKDAYKFLIDDTELLIKYLETKSDKDYQAFLRKHNKLYDELKKMFDNNNDE